MPISEDIGDRVKRRSITPRRVDDPLRELIDVLGFEIRQAELNNCQSRQKAIRDLHI